MSGDQIVFHPDAALELEAGVAWYAARSRKAASQFLIELDRAIAAIIRVPAELDASYWTMAPLSAAEISFSNLLSGDRFGR